MLTATKARTFRIGEVARRLGVTTRAIRYYEELGLLPSPRDRPQGVHRVYDEAAVARLQQILKLRGLLGLSLEAIIAIADADTSREALRDTWDADPSAADRARILDEAKLLVLRQLELVKERQAVLSRFACELRRTLGTIEERRAALDAEEGN
jgi:DNA-binding transcriptional MerR regulator